MKWQMADFTVRELRGGDLSYLSPKCASAGPPKRKGLDVSLAFSSPEEEERKRLCNDKTGSLPFAADAMQDFALPTDLLIPNGRAPNVSTWTMPLQSTRSRRRSLQTFDDIRLRISISKPSDCSQVTSRSRKGLLLQSMDGCLVP